MTVPKKKNDRLEARGGRNARYTEAQKQFIKNATNEELKEATERMGRSYAALRNYRAYMRNFDPEYYRSRSTKTKKQTYRTHPSYAIIPLARPEWFNETLNLRGRR